jgi:acrylyl-CoA reductase (NADPH)
MPLRQKVWQRLATDLKPRHLADIANFMRLADLPAYFDRMLKGTIRGRGVVRVS